MTRYSLVPPLSIQGARAPLASAAKLALALIALCLSAAPASAVTVEVNYAGRPAVTHQISFFPADLFFAQLDSWRHDADVRIPQELNGNFGIHSSDARLEKDLRIELTGREAGEADIIVAVFGGDIVGRIDCSGGTDLDIDIDFDAVQAAASYSLVSGLSPLEISVPGLDIDIDGFSFGIGFCTMVSLADLVSGGDVYDGIESWLEDLVVDHVAGDIVPSLDLGGFGGAFLAVGDYLEQVPEPVFQVIGLERTTLIEHVTNPFDGIWVRIRFVEGEDGGFGAGDRIVVDVEIPWEIRPVARFDNSAWNGAIRFDAGGSLDPDGGGIVRYEWNYGDGHSNYSTAPVVVHNYQEQGIYTATLRVFDDEGAVMTTSRTINTCSYLDCSGGGGGGGGPFTPDIE